MPEIKHNGWTPEKVRKLKKLLPVGGMKKIGEKLDIKHQNVVNEFNHDKVKAQYNPKIMNTAMGLVAQVCKEFKELQNL